MAYPNKQGNRDFNNRSNQGSSKMQNFRNSQHSSISNGDTYFENKPNNNMKVGSDYFNSQSNMNNRDQHFNHKNNINRRGQFSNKIIEKQPNSAFQNQNSITNQGQNIPDFDQLKSFVKEQSEKFKQEYNKFMEINQKSGSPSPGSTHEYGGSYKSYPRNNYGVQNRSFQGSSNVNMQSSPNESINNSGNKMSGNGGYFNKASNNSYNKPQTNLNKQSMYIKQQSMTINNSSEEQHQFSNRTNSRSYSDVSSTSINNAVIMDKSSNSMASNLSSGNKLNSSQTMTGLCRQDSKKCGNYRQNNNQTPPTTYKAYSFVTGSNLPSMGTSNSNNNNVSPTSAKNMSLNRNINHHPPQHLPLTSLNRQNSNREERAVVSVVAVTTNNDQQSRSQLRSQASSSDLEQSVSSPTGSIQLGQQQPNQQEQFFTPDPPASPSSNRSSPKRLLSTSSNNSNHNASIKSKK